MGITVLWKEQLQKLRRPPLYLGTYGPARRATTIIALEGPNSKIVNWETLRQEREEMLSVSVAGNLHQTFAESVYS